MADRYWVGGTGTWNTTSTTNWSASSGGASGASVPTVADNVFFDQAGTYTVTMTGSLTCLDITVSAGTVTFATGASPFINIRGSMSLVAGTVWGGIGLTFSATTTGKTITTNGTTIGSFIEFTGIGGGWTLGSALTAQISINVRAGTFDTSSTGNYSVTSDSFQFSNQLGARTVNFNASTITASGSGAIIQTGTVTLNAGTSQINLTNANARYQTNGGLTFYNLAFTSTTAGTHANTGANTFNNFAVTAPAAAGTTSVTFDSRQTINGTLSTTSTAGNRRVFFASPTYGIAYNLIINSAPSLTDADFRDIYVTGTASPISGTRVGNRGGCRNITFDTPKTVYWNLAGAQNWSADAWATTPTGAPSTNNFPLPQDTATFTNAGSVTGTITLDTAIGYVPNVDMSGRTTAMTLGLSNATTVYGSWTNGSGTAFTGTATLTFSGGSAQTITSAGKTFGCAITIDTYDGTVQLADALNTGGQQLTVDNGTFTTAGYATTCGPFVSSNSNVRTINLSSSTVTSSFINIGASANITFNAGTSNVDCSGGFSASGVTWYNVTLTSAALSPFSGTFNNLTLTAPASAGIKNIPVGGNITVNGTLTCAGASVLQRLFLRSDTLGTQRTLTVASISATDCDFRDINLAGTASGSTPTRAGDLGGNSGITFTSKTVYWNLAGAQNWSATGWATASGGAPAANNFPLAQDTAVFDNTGAAGTVTIEYEWAIGTLNMSARTSAMTLSLGAGAAATGALPPIYGNVTLGSGVTTSTAYVTVAKMSFVKNGTQTVTSNGATFLFNLSVDRAQTTLTLGDAITVGTSATLIVTAGTFNAATYNVTVNAFQCTGSNSNAIRFGTGSWSLTGTGTVWNCSSLPPYVEPGTATITLTNNTTTARTMSFGNSSGVGLYPKIIIGGNTSTSTTTLNGVVATKELASTKTVAHTITFSPPASSGWINNIGVWSVTGTVGNVVTVNNSGFVLGGGLNMYVSAPTSGIDYLAINGSSFVISFENNSGVLPETFYAGVNSTTGGAFGVFGATLTATPAARTLYWVGGTGNWNNTARWSTSSGGPSGAAIPTSLDSVVFDSASSAASYTVTANIAQVRCAGLTASAPATGSLTLSGASPFYLYGNTTLAATGVIASAARFYLCGKGSSTFTTNGLTTDNFNFGCPAAPTWTLNGALTLASSFSAIGINYGKFVTAGYTVTGGYIFSNTYSATELDLGASTVSLTNTTQQNNVPQIIGGTSTITFVSTGTYTFGSAVRGYPTFNNVTFSTTSDSASITLPTGTTYNNLTINGPTSTNVIKTFSLSGPITVSGTLTLTGSNYVRRVALRSATLGTPVTVTANAITVTDADLRDITISGAAAGTVLTRAGDQRGNTGVTFPAAKTVYWNLAGSQNWSATGWAGSSGAAPAASNFPLAQDTAIFDNTGAAGTVTFDVAWSVGTLDASLRTSAMTLSTSTVVPVVYGDWKFGTGVTSSSTTGALTFSRNGTQTITSNGVQFGCPITINRPLCTVQLADALSLNSARTLTLTAGTFDAVSYNVTTGLFSNSATTNVLKLGSGTWTLSGTGTVWNCATVPAVTAGTANIVLSDTTASARTFAGGGATYNRLTIGGTTGTSTLTISGNNTFTEIASTKTVAHTISLTASTNQNVAAWTVTGTAGNVVTLTASSAATLVYTGGSIVNVDYLNVTNVRAFSFTNKWYVGSNSVNNGSWGLIFSAGPGVYAAVILETATGTDQIIGFLTYLSSVSENGTASDIISAAAGFYSSLQESGTATDQIAASAAFAPSINETGSASDQVVAAAAFSSQTAETGSATDQVSVAAAFAPSVSESGAATDQVVAAASFASSASDSGTATDQMAASAAFAAATNESATATDQSLAAVSFSSLINELLSASDSVVAASLMSVDVSETATASDTVLGGLTYLANIAESATAYDLILAAFLWNLINDAQNANWNVINDTQTSTWAHVDSSQSGGWNIIPITGVLGSTWPSSAAGGGTAILLNTQVSPAGLRYYALNRYNVWTVQRFPVVGSFGAVSYLNGQYFVYSSPGATPESPLIRSTDGVNWTPVTTLPTSAAQVTGMFANGSTIVAVYNGQTYVTTDNCATWTAGSAMPSALQGFVVGLNYGSGLYILCDGRRIFSSPDALTWTTRATITYSLGTSGHRGTVAWDGSRFAVVTRSSLNSQAPAFRTSTNGTTWTTFSPPSPISSQAVAVLWDGSQFVFVCGGAGSTPASFYSANSTLTTFTLLGSFPGFFYIPATLSHYLFGNFNGQYVMPGFASPNNGPFYTSPNFSTFNAVIPPLPTDAWGNIATDQTPTWGIIPNQ